MRNLLLKIVLSFLLFCQINRVEAQQLYEFPAGKAESRLSSFENPNGVKGNGGRTNRTAKGNAFELVRPGEIKSLIDIKTAGIIQRIWLTIDQDPVRLRSLRLQMFWDNSGKAAVDVPLGDFFCYNLGKRIAFQSALFSSGEGRSFMCYIPMPFRTGAKITLTNDGTEPVMLFYDVDYLLTKPVPGALYFHASWNRKWTGKIGDDFELLPKVNGKGRFLGVSVGLNSDSSYERSWWGEGEVKMYIDGDTQYPSINGTGSEDYVGSAWGLGTFMNQYQGCTVASDSLRQFNFYRWHLPDAIYFDHDIRVVIQQIGGWDRDQVRQLLLKGVKLEPISVASANGFLRLFEQSPPLKITDEKFPEGWVNFYRIDDYSAVSYFYLDKPASNLPGLPSLDIRLFQVNK